MLPKSERLKEKYLFDLAFNLGKKRKQKINSDLLSLYYLYRKKDINKSSFKTISIKTAFIVGLRVDKKANKRNIVKRRMRAAYAVLMKKNLNQLKNKISVLIWIANPLIKGATFEQIKTSMEKLIIRLHNFQGNI